MSTCLALWALSEAKRADAEAVAAKEPKELALASERTAASEKARADEEAVRAKVSGELTTFMRDVFGKVDVLHTPLLPMPVPTIAETMPSNGVAYLDMVVSLTRNTKVVNYLGLPAMSVPCGLSGNGLPVAFQLIGRPFDEAMLFQVGQAYESATDWHLKVPGIATAATSE